MSVKNIKALRDHALKTLNMLEENDIEIKDALANAALYSSVMATVKLELDYHKMLGQKPNIQFLESSPIYDPEPNTLSIEHNSNDDYEGDDE